MKDGDAAPVLNLSELVSGFIFATPLHTWCFQFPHPSYCAHDLRETAICFNSLKMLSQRKLLHKDAEVPVVRDSSVASPISNNNTVRRRKPVGVSCDGCRRKKIKVFNA